MWIDLEKDKPYYIEGRTYDQGGASHFTVAVEIVRPEADRLDSGSFPVHRNAVKHKQELFIEQTGVGEINKIVVENSAGLAGDGWFRPRWIRLVYDEENPDSDPIIETHNCPLIPVDTDLDWFKRAISSYYRKAFGSDIEVSVVNYDIDDNETDDMSVCTKREFTITVLKRIN